LNEKARKLLRKGFIRNYIIHLPKTSKNHVQLVTSKERLLLLLAVLIAGLCSIVYELELSTVSSYFLGDSIKQFSLIIGVYMAAMGVGSFVSKYIPDPLIVFFIGIEIALGLVGGLSVPVAYWAFERTSAGGFQALVLGITFLIGMFTGLEIPLLARILKEYYPLRTNLANVLSLDYIGALLATLLFPFLLLPKMGLFRTAIGVGLLNILLGWIMLAMLRAHIPARTRGTLQWMAFGLMLVLATLFYFSGPMLQAWQDSAYNHKVIWAKQTPYQHLAVTQKGDDTRLYINRVIQFSTRDEYRYHEVLGLLPMLAAQRHAHVLILGGGEGLLAREVLKFADVERVTIVDLDPEVFQLAKTFRPIVEANQGALNHPKVQLVAQDASVFLHNTTERFDVILADLPDPSNEAVARLYSDWFYKMARNALAPNGIYATQATSIFNTSRAFWCIGQTLESAGFGHVVPLRTYVPSFGEWGFFLASERPIPMPPLPADLPTKFLDSAALRHVFSLSKDNSPPQGLRPNQLDQPALLEYFLQDWASWSREKAQ
jgi:spermidine synthase